MTSVANLISGYHTFRNHFSEADAEHFESLANGQSPKTLMITCSDSRVSPGLLTGAKPGELFVIRNAGNVVPPVADTAARSDLATVQYAVEVLNVDHIVVCGHSDCGAVKAMMKPESVSALPHIADWIEQSLVGLELDPSSPVLENVKRNAVHQIARLLELPYVKAKVESGELALHPWVFDIGTATIEHFSEGSGKWSPLGQ